MKCLLLLAGLMMSFLGLSQTFNIFGYVLDEQHNPIPLSIPFSSPLIHLHSKGLLNISTTPDKKGYFKFQGVTATGTFYLTITAPGFEGYNDTITKKNIDSITGINLGHIYLLPALHVLEEFKKVEKIIAVVQKDDTLEFNSVAYKVHPDADGLDLVQKMPTIELNEHTLTAQGQNVLKILVDGKPFFGDDPYASLKNLPADMIDKVQVYNEKTDQEQFTGFKEENTYKTINIITLPDKRNGIFGKIYAGYGADKNNEDKFGLGTTLNEFKADRRITLTASTNNVNEQNFTDANAAGGGAGGLVKVNAAGVNYLDKWGKKVDFSTSYFFNETNSNSTTLLQKTYILSIDSGQVYNQNSSSRRNNYTHKLNTRFDYKIDSLNSILWTPNLNFNINNGYTTNLGTTTDGLQPINNINNNANNNQNGINVVSNVLYKHKFYKKGRTISASLQVNNNSTYGKTEHIAQNIFYNSLKLSDTLNQQNQQNLSKWNIICNLTYTEPIGEFGSIKIESNAYYLPGQSINNTNDYSYITQGYTKQDSIYSNSYISNSKAQKTGASYQLKIKDLTLSLGVYYKVTQLINHQLSPIEYRLNQQFYNLLPVATFHYKISTSKSLEISYGTNDVVPAVNQVQPVLNNADPLHLYIGNPALKQLFRNNLSIIYNATSKEAKSSFSAGINGSFTENGVGPQILIAPKDTLLPALHIIVPQGSQLTMPININENIALNANMNYSMPMQFIKCNLKYGMNIGYYNTPILINNLQNIQENKNCGLSLSINSNISENLDFIVSSSTNITETTNSLNPKINNNYINENIRAYLNFIFWKGFIFNTHLSFQTNSGSTVGYISDYLLWNMSFGKRVFKNNRGDIRLSFFDVLNENKNIQHSIMENYIQDTKAKVLQQYFLVVFTYSIKDFNIE